MCGRLCKMKHRSGYKLLLVACVAAFPACARPAETNRAPGTVLWTNWVRVYYPDSSPAIAPDGTIYVGSWKKLLFAFQPDGRIKWTFRALSEIKSTPAIGADGTIYFGARDKYMYAVTPEGKLKWRFRTGGWVDASPSIGRTGTVYFGSWDKKFYALDATGQKQWELATAGPITSSAAIDTNGTIYFGSHDAHLYALSPDGTKLWSFKTGGPVLASPAIGPDGTVVFASVDGRLYAIGADGKLKWQLWTGGVSEGSPVIAPDGSIFCIATDRLLRISPDGTKEWDKKISAHQWTDSAPVVTDDGGVYVFNGDGVIVSYSAAGAWRWQKWLGGGGGTASPAIGSDGTIYAGLCGGSFHALFGTNKLATGGWPMFKHNLRRTGNAVDSH